jgi:DNA-binding CsgD family transcriptional regulator/GAF domain-containing protein
MANALPEELTDAVYRAALEPAAWGDVMRSMNQRFPSAAQTFYFLHLRPRRVQPVSLVGVEPQWLRSFDELYFADDNPWIRLTRHLHRPGVVRTNERLDHFLGEAGALYRSAYYNEWMRPQRFRYTIGTTLLAEDGLVANITLLRAPDMRSFSAGEVRAFEMLSKHLTRALQLSVQLERPQTCPASVSVLDALPQAVAVLDAQHRVLYANTAMDSLLARKQGFALRQDRLQVGDPAVQQQFVALVDAALAGGDAAAGNHESLALRLSGAGHLRVRALPLRGKLARSLAFRPSVLLMATEQAMAGTISQAVIGRIYGCTPSEARLVSLLVEGQTLKRAATHMGITYESARAYVKLIFQKVGVHSQSQLVARVLGDVGV